MFKPTWLYIKQHRVTGLKYLGKTTRSDPYTYRGSGKRWKHHLKVHGYEIDTIWCELFESESQCTEKALELSRTHSVVVSGDWANLKSENGIDGSLPGQWVGEKSPMYGVKGVDHPAYGRVDSEKTRKQKATAKMGDLNPMKDPAVAARMSATKKANGLYEPKNNPRYNPTKHTWENIHTGETKVATRLEMTQMDPKMKPSISTVIKGKRGNSRGWRLK
jgi:hypothetical protein